MKKLLILPLFLIIFISCSKNAEKNLVFPNSLDFLNPTEDLNEIKNLGVNDLIINPSPANYGNITANIGIKDIKISIKNISSSEGKI